MNNVLAWQAIGDSNPVREFRSKGITLPLVDTLIATTCIINNLILVTYDTKHYSIPDLKLWHFS